MVITITTHSICTTTMSQYIPIHLPLPSPQSSPVLPERPTSVSTTSTIGSPFSPNPYSTSFTPTPPSPPSPSQSEQQQVTVVPSIFPAVLDPNLHLSARKIKSEFNRRDFLLARYIVSILAQRIELGILSPSNGIGFPFTDKDERKVP